MPGNPGMLTLSGLETPPSERPIGQTERKVEEQLDLVRAEKEFTPSDEMLAEVARALAQNIDRGNLKGRSIGNEAAQMLACLEQLRGETVEAVEASDIPAETKEFMDGLGTVPRIGRAAAGHDAA